MSNVVCCARVAQVAAGQRLLVARNRSEFTAARALRRRVIAAKRCGLRDCARVLLCCCLITAAGNAVGQTFWVGTPNVFENWSTASNWSLGVPNSSSGTTFDAVIANNGGAQLSVAGASVRRLRVGRQEGPGQLFVDGGGLTVTENLHINEGGTGLGAMLVDNGGIVTSPATVVGYSSTGPSFLQISGVDSKVDATSSFIVGRAGNGTMTLTASGELAIGNGTLPLQIATLAGSTGAAYLGNGGVAGVLTASAVQFGLGDALLGFDHTNDVTFAIPISGAGRISKTGPGKTTLSAMNTYTGGNPLYDAGTTISRGTLEVTGSISHLAANFKVGTFPPGNAATLAIRGGGTVTNAVGHIGDAVNSIGVVTVDGPGSEWTNGSNVIVGYQGAGTLGITGGGHVTNHLGYVGYLQGTTGSVTVDGPGSSWANNSELYIGVVGAGSLDVTGGGQVSNIGDAYVGAFDGSSGKVTVDGPGSAWTVFDYDEDEFAGLYVGFSGTGSISVTDGGVIDATQAANGIQVGSFGSIGGDGTLIGNVTNSGNMIPGASPGTLHVDGNYTQSSSGALVIFADLFLPGVPAAKLDVTGDVVLDGRLQMNLSGMGQFRGTRSFDILDWDGNLNDEFSSLQLPMFGGNFTWDTSQLYISGVLTLTGPPLEGDYNQDGTVDAADYVVWRKELDTTYTQDHYNLWRANFGATTDSGAGATAESPSRGVPEPASLALLFFAAGLLVLQRDWAVKKYR